MSVFFVDILTLRLMDFLLCPIVESISMIMEGIAKLPLIWGILYRKVNKYWRDSPSETYQSCRTYL